MVMVWYLEASRAKTPYSPMPPRKHTSTSPPPPPSDAPSRERTVGPSSPSPDPGQQSPLMMFPSPTAVRQSPRRATTDAKEELERLKTQTALMKARMAADAQKARAEAAKRKIEQAAQRMATKAKQAQDKRRKKFAANVAAAVAAGKKKKRPHEEPKDAEGSKWTSEQTQHLLDVMLDVMPVAKKGWEAVQDAVNTYSEEQGLSWPRRHVDHCRNKWTKLKSQLGRAKPTGDPERPAIYGMIKDVVDAIETKYSTQAMGGEDTDSMQESDGDDDDGGDDDGGDDDDKDGKEMGGGGAPGKRPESPLDLSGAEMLASGGNHKTLKKLRTAQQAASDGSWRADHGGGGESSKGKSAKHALAAAAGALENIANKEPSASSSNTNFLAMMMLQMRKSEQREARERQLREERDRADRLDREERMDKADADRQLALQQSAERQTIFMASFLRPQASPSLPQLSPPGNGVIDLVTPDGTPTGKALFQSPGKRAASKSPAHRRVSPRVKQETSTP
jgi:hypothetical protein